MIVFRSCVLRNLCGAAWAPWLAAPFLALGSVSWMGLWTWTRAGVRGAYSLLSNSFLAGNCRLVLTALTRLHMPGVCRRLVLLYRSTRLMARLVASDARHPRGGG
ncbi:hypothetical protein C8J57DRAFT_1318582 [Mycena rebaudengoi]|nr:hypothetical protein C8J57DRAFT_1318582 [Mycena rebaudengoi]